MSTFTHLKKLDVTAGRTARMTLFGLEDEPVLILAPATESNKPYFNGLLKRSRNNVSRLQAQQFTAELTKANRDDDRRLYAEFVVKGWERVRDDQHQLVDFTLENVQAFLEALPDYIFDDVRVFATAPRNFIDDLVSNPEEVAGNSQSV